MKEEAPPSGNGSNGSDGNVDARKLVPKFYRGRNYLLPFASAQNILSGGRARKCISKSRVPGYPAEKNKTRPGPHTFHRLSPLYSAYKFRILKQCK